MKYIRLFEDFDNDSIEDIFLPYIDDGIPCQKIFDNILSFINLNQMHLLMMH